MTREGFIEGYQALLSPEKLGRGMLVFVEVKRRRRPIVDDPVGEAQWRRLEATALRYMMEAETGDAPMRFDLALVGADGVTEVTRNARC